MSPYLFALPNPFFNLIGAGVREMVFGKGASGGLSDMKLHKKREFSFKG